MFFRLYLLSSGKLLTSSNCALHHLSEGCLITVIIALTQTRRFTFLHEFRGDNKKHSFVSVRQKQENSIFLSARFVRRFSNQIAWKQNYLFEMSQPQPNASDAWSRLRRDFIYFVRSEITDEREKSFYVAIETRDSKLFHLRSQHGKTFDSELLGFWWYFLGLS